jgi:hypothetical protein
MRHIVLLTLLACAVALAMALQASAGDPAPPPTTTATSTTSTSESSAAPRLTHAQVQRLIDRYRHRTWHWQRVMGRPVTLTLRRPPADPLARIAKWKRIAARTQRIAHNPPHLRAWRCIHRYEAGWSDAGAPYYGGLQMDLGFQRRYGWRLLAHKGTADRWSPLEQMWVAERALRAGRWFYPWPNSARACGLI